MLAYKQTSFIPVIWRLAISESLSCEAAGKTAKRSGRAVHAETYKEEELCYTRFQMAP